MRLLLFLAAAGLTTTSAFAQATKPEQGAPPDRSSPTNGGSTSDVGVSVDVGSLLKGLVKAVRKPPPPKQEPDAPALQAQDSGSATGSPAPIEPAAPIDTALAAPPAPVPASLPTAPASTPSAQVTPAPPRAAQPPSAPPLERLAPPPLASPITPAPAVAIPPSPAAVDPGPKAKADKLSPGPIAAAPGPSNKRPPLGLMMILALAIAALAAAVWWRHRRILSHTRSLLSVSSRLEFSAVDIAPSSLRLAAPPVAIRARLDTVPRHG